MTTINTLPYRIAIRESGSTRAVTDWLESKISPDCWKVELLDVEEYDDENRKIHYVIRFRYQTDLQRFRTAFLNKSKKGFAGRPSGGARVTAAGKGQATAGYALRHSLPFGVCF